MAAPALERAAGERWVWVWPTGAHLALVAAAIAATLGLVGSFSLQGWHQALSGWDSHWYLLLGRQGYPSHLAPQWAYFPLYPGLIMALVHLGVPALGAALLISLLSTAALAFCLVRLTEVELGARAGAWLPWMLLLSPFGFFFAAAYSEALFFALAAASLLCARRGRFTWAGALGGLAAATRITGVLLLVPLLLEALQQRGWDPRRLSWAQAGIALVPLGLLGFAVFARLRAQSWLAFTHAESAFFGLRAAWPWNGFQLTWSAALGGSPQSGAFQVELVAGLLGIPVLALAIWRLRPLYWSFMVLSWLGAVSLVFWRSVPRYELAFFPILLLVLSATERARWLRWVLLVAGGATMAYGASVFARGLWLD
ncbi:MAG: mannosyltransferase family protein [Candidatus Dormibacteria bacterium]